MSRLLAKKWAIALVVSLALNLFLGGMAVARWLRGPSWGPPRGGHSLRFDALRQGLGPASKEIVDQVEAKHAAAIRKSIREMRAARREAMDALIAEPFDEARAKEAHAALLAKESAARQATHEALVELAAQLPAAERAKLGEAMRHRKGRRGSPGRRSRAGRDDHRGPQHPPGEVHRVPAQGGSRSADPPPATSESDTQGDEP